MSVTEVEWQGNEVTLSLSMQKMALGSQLKYITDFHPSVIVRRVLIKEYFEHWQEGIFLIATKLWQYDGFSEFN